MDFKLYKEYSIDNLVLPYLKNNCEEEIKKCFSLIRPNLSMIEKTNTGYIYFEIEIQQLTITMLSYFKNMCQEGDSKKIFNGIMKQLDYLCESSLITQNNKNSNNDKKNNFSSQIHFFENFNKMIDLIKTLVNNNCAYLEDVCIFNSENIQVFEKLPNSVVLISIFTLLGTKFGISEIKHGLLLIKILAFSQSFVSNFIKFGGMEVIFSLLLSDQKPICIDIKILVLEVVYMLLSHKHFFEKLIEKNHKFFRSRYFTVKEVNYENYQNNYLDLKESSVFNENKKGRYRSRSNSKDSRSSTETYELKDGSRKIKLKNGYQILVVILLSKSNYSLLNCIIQKIMNKISFILFLKEIYSLYEDCNYILSENNDSNIKNTLDLSKSFKSNNEKNKVKDDQNTNVKEIQNNTLINNSSLILDQSNISQKKINRIDKINKNVNFEKLSFIIKNIYLFLTSDEINYRKNEKDEEILFQSKGYSYHHFWRTMSKVSKYFYGNLDINFNLNSNMKICNKETGKYNNTITNDTCILLEQFNFLQIISWFFENDLFKKSRAYTYCCYQFKTLFSYIINCDGGINYLSKNYDLTTMVLNSLINSTDFLIKEPHNQEMREKISKSFKMNSNLWNLQMRQEIFSIENMYSICNYDLYPEFAFAGTTLGPGSAKNLNFGDESNFDDIKLNQMSIAKVLIQKEEISSDLYIYAHFLQLRYLLEENLKLISKIDDLKSSKIEETDFIDKSLTILMYISANSDKSNLSKQAFSSVFTNNYCHKEIIEIIKFMALTPLEYEPHLTLFIDLYEKLFLLSINNKKINNFLSEYGGLIYDEFSLIKAKEESIYENEDLESCMPYYKQKMKSFLNLLYPTKIISVNRNGVNIIMDMINNNCLINAQKYNLLSFEKPIKEANFKEFTKDNIKVSIKEYINNMKLNLLEYKNNDIYFLGNIEDERSLINSITVSLRVINNMVIKFNF